MSTKRGRYARTNKKRVSKFFDFVRDEKMTFFYSAATLFKHKTICSDFALDVNSSSKKKLMVMFMSISEFSAIFIH